MTPQEIMDAVSKLHGKVDDMGYSDVRPAVKKLLECIFYLAKQQLPEGPSRRKNLVLKPSRPKAKKKPAKKAR